LFTKHESKLVTYVVGPAKSTVDYIMVLQKDEAKVSNVKVITSEEYVPKHKLQVMNMSCGLKQQKVGVGSSSQECVYGSLRRCRPTRVVPE